MILYLLYSFSYSSIDKFLKVIPYLFTFFIAYILVYNNLLNRFSLYIVVTSIIALGIIFSDLDLFISSILSGTRGRYDVNPLNISSLALISTLISYIRYRMGNNKLYLFLAIMLFIISFAGGSKGPLLSFFISLFFVNLFLDNKKLKTIILSVIIFIISFFIVLILAYNEIKIAERFLGLSTSNNVTSTESRTEMYSSTINKIIDSNIIFGSGVDTFEHHEHGHPHNILLELSYEIGFLPTFIIIFTLLYFFMINKFYSYSYLYSGLFIYLLFEAQFSHDLSFLRNILFMYFILMWSYEKDNRQKRRSIHE